MQSVIWKEPLHARGAGTRPTPQLARVLKQALMGAMLIKKRVARTEFLDAFIECLPLLYLTVQI